MKILAGGMNYNAHVPMLEALSEISDVKCLDTDNADIIYDVEKDSFLHILNKFPDKWEPDLVIWWVPEYNTIISKIEQSPYPVVVVVMDWNLGIAALKNNLKRFDWIFIDRAGVEVLNRAGYQNVSFWKIASFDPGLFKYYPELDKIYDVLFIGHFNHSVHRERSKWLKRLALLGNKYNIKILTGVYGEENPKYLNQAKICFNYSVRSEANLRTFEASTCKTLLFIEDSNIEVKDFFTDRKECVYYNEGNFEQLIDYYLNNDAEREQIAESAYKKVQTESYLEHFKYLLKIIKEKKIDKIKDFNRPFTKIEKLDKLFENCLILIQGISKGSVEASVKAGERLVNIAKKNPNSWNTLGVIYANKLLNSENNELNKSLIANSLNVFNQATLIDPYAILPYYNRASVFFSIGNYDLYEQELLKAYNLFNLTPDNLFSCKDLFFPRDFDLFRVTWEKCTGRYIENNSLLFDSYKNLLKWNICEKLGDLYRKKSNYRESIDWYGISINSVEGISDLVRAKRARVLFNLGKIEEALIDYEIAFEQFPFDTGIWFYFINSLFISGNIDKCRKYSEELITIIKSCPFYESEMVWLQPILDKLNK